MSEQPDAASFIRALVGAWDCCATCAGGVLLRHDRERMAQAWDEGHATCCDDRCFSDGNPYRDPSC